MEVGAAGTAQPGWVAIPIETRCDGTPFGPAHRTRFRATDRIANFDAVCTIPSPGRSSAP